MPEECEFLSVCNSEGGHGCPFTPWTKESEDMMISKMVMECDHRQTYLHYLNSPQFTKQYTAWKNCESIRDTAHKDGIAFGQQNPDPEQYAKRVDLVKQVRRYLTKATGLKTIVNLIQTHGLKPKEDSDFDKEVEDDLGLDLKAEEEE